MNNRKRTLVILTPGFAQSEADTNCLPMQQYFVRTLNETYPELQVIIVSFQYPFYKNTYKWHGATVISFGGKNRGGISGLLLRTEINKALKKLNKENHIIGVLSFWYGECAVVAQNFSSKYGTRHFCWLLGQDARKRNKYPGRVSLRGDQLIALSDFLQNEFEKNYGVKPLHVIPPGMKAGYSSRERDIDILAAGSLIPLKQYQIFVDIIAELKKSKPGIKAMLLGDGPEKKNLQTLVDQYGLQANINLPGELPHNEVLQLMQKAKVFLHPSSYEGFSGVCLEALSAGANVVSFCKPMNKDIEHWHIVNTNSKMKEKAIELLENQNALYKPVTIFKMEDTVAKMMALFNS